MFFKIQTRSLRDFVKSLELLVIYLFTIYSNLSSGIEDKINMKLQNHCITGDKFEFSGDSNHTQGIIFKDDKWKIAEVLHYRERLAETRTLYLQFPYPPCS